MAATQANLEPIFLIYDGEQPGVALHSVTGHSVTGHTAIGEGATGEGATGVVDWITAGRAPLVSITTEDSVTHRLWRIGDSAEQGAISADLAGRRALIADGHHRYAAYLDLQAEMHAAGLGAGPWDYGLAFLVDSAAYPPRLGAIHRVLPGLPPDRAAELAKAAFTVQDLPAGLSLEDALQRLAAAGREGPAFLLAGAPVFRLLSHPDPVQLAASMPAGTSAPWQTLDASVMQQLLLGRLWGVIDSERDVLIDHDAADAVRAVSGDPTATDIAERPAGSRFRPPGRGYRRDLKPGVLRSRRPDRGSRRAGTAKIHLVRPQTAHRPGPAHVRPVRLNGRHGRRNRIDGHHRSWARSIPDRHPDGRIRRDYGRLPDPGRPAVPSGNRDRAVRAGGP